MSDTIRALSLWQPWASAISCGAKRIETRSWATSYRGPLLIHAAKHYCQLDIDYMTYTDGMTIWESAFPWLFAEPMTGAPADQFKRLPLGALIAVAKLVDCFRTESLTGAVMAGKPLLSAQELALGDYSPGRYGWVLANVRALPAPIPYRGRQGLFDVPAELLPAELRGEA